MGDEPPAVRGLTPDMDGCAGRYGDLKAAEGDIWARLGRAVVDRRSPWHTPVLATVTADGAPALRVLVLRGVARAERRLRLHTDIRSAKVGEIAAEPRVGLLFYDKAAKLQLRVSGTAQVAHDGAEADSAWAATRLFGRRCYTAPVAPGTPAPGPVSGLPAELEHREPTREESETGRPNFAIVLVEVVRLEFLHLAVTGHRRGVLTWDPHGRGWEGRWLVP